MDIEGKKVAILGGKRSGMALARLVTRLQGHAKVSDSGDENCLADEFKIWAKKNNVDLEFNGHTREFIEDSDFVVLSPGVRFDSEPVRWARVKNILVLGEIEFAFQFCSKPIIAVTGSNGKTTVSTLIHHIIEASGKKACLCGNVGFPFSGVVLDLDDVDYVTLEISSFQLEAVVDSTPGIQGFEPYITVILNFSQNHLDRHKDLQEYFDAKKRVFLNQDESDFLVLNDKDEQVRNLANETRAKAVYFNRHCDDHTESVGCGNPNHLAVEAVGQILGIDKVLCQKVFQEFKGVEHRLEKVRCFDGVDYINDSKATTVESGQWALNHIHQPIVIICGGRDKNSDFSVLADMVHHKVKKMFVIGEARPKIRAAFSAVVDFQECEGLEDAVSQARQSALKGDCVLLSPMCASFDMFSDFEDRGRVFKSIVNQLK